MKIRNKLIYGYLVVALLGSLTLYFTLNSYSNISQEFHDLMHDPVPSIKSLEELKHAGIRIVSSTSEYLLIRNETSWINELFTEQEAETKQIALGRENYYSSLQRYRELQAKNGRENDSAELLQLKDTGEKLLRSSEEIIKLKDDGASGEKILEKKEEFERIEMTYLSSVNRLLEIEYEELAEQQHHVQTTMTDATRQTVAVTVSSLILAIFLGVYVSRLISRRIEKLKEASEKIGLGQFETQLEFKSKDEIGDLSRAFNKMVSDLSRSRNDLISAKNFTENIIGSMADALFILDKKLNISEVNRAAMEITGYRREELIKKSVNFLSCDDNWFTPGDLAELYSHGFMSGIDKICLAKNGKNVSLSLSASILRDGEGKEIGVVCVARDMSERQILEARLEHQAFHDSLTNLANRALFQDRLAHALNRAKRRQMPLAVMFLDMDNFKNVNDSLGHAAGDHLLKTVAERLQSCLRTSDTVARFGGDEFAILLEETEQPYNPIEAAERVLKIFDEPIIIESREINAGISIGIAISEKGEEQVDELLRNADVAMYNAKEQGKGTFTIFESKMHVKLMERIHLEADLRRAIDAREFVLYYQPIMHLKTKKLTAFEALVRWRHPTRGLIPPLSFIETAEQTGLIVPLGCWILNEACRQIREFRENFGAHLKMTVNVSGRQFQTPDFVEVVADAIAVNRIAPSSLTLEITESIMMQNSETTLNRLNELKNLGVRLAIDDFGVGYSSLSYLQQFPIDILKIDKSFVDEVAKGEDESAVARTIINLSETLKLKTIAEGIEHAEQIATLIEGGCEFGQGFYFSKPLCTEDIMTLFADKDGYDHSFIPNRQQMQEAIAA